MHIRYRLLSIKGVLKALWHEKKQSLKPKVLLQNSFFIGGLFVFSLIPFLFAFGMINKRFKQLEEKQKNFEQIIWRGKHLIQMQKSRSQFLEKYQQVNPDYFNHTIEELTFLKPEIEALKVIYGHPAFQSCPAVKERLNYLTKGGNRLVFIEQKREVSQLIEEMHYKQGASIEVNGEDIKNILSIIEGVSIGPYQPPPCCPQLVVSRFDLKRELLIGRESYFLEMNLIKRELFK